jgi:LCP family protein required for cell wall assembly
MPKENEIEFNNITKVSEDVKAENERPLLEKVTPEEEPKRRSNKKPSKKKKIIKRLLLIILAMLLIAAGVIAWQIQSIKKVIDNSNVALSNTPKTKFTQEPTNILILGVDEAFDDKSTWRTSQNTDAILIARFDPVSKKITTASIPRDVVAQSTCEQSTVKDQYVKINSITANVVQYDDRVKTIKSGLECFVNVMKTNYNITINEVVRLNFKAVIDLIDQIGGLEFAPDVQNFGPGAEDGFCAKDEYGKEDAYCFKPGVSQKMNGATALAYARERYADSDFYRGLRQQEVVFQLTQKIKTDVSLLAKIPSLIGALENNMMTTFNSDIVNDVASLSTSFGSYQTKSIGKLDTVKIDNGENYAITEEDKEKLEKVFNGK